MIARSKLDSSEGSLGNSEIACQASPRGDSPRDPPTQAVLQSFTHPNRSTPNAVVKSTLSWSICNENYKFAKSTEVENRWVEGTAFCRRTPSLQLNEDATCRVCHVQVDMCMYFVNANEAKVTGQLRRHVDQLNQPSPLYLIRSEQHGAPHHANSLI